MCLRKVILLFSLVISYGCSFSQTNAITAKQLFKYVLKPVPNKKGMDFKINVEFKSDSTITFTSPIDYYGVKDYGQHFKEFKGENGTIVNMTAQKNQYIAKPNNQGIVYIDYILSLSQEEMNSISYAPNISPTHFHLAGSQWILPIGSLEKINAYHVKIVDYPKGWNFYSSESNSPLNMTFESTYEQLIGSGFGGGNQQHKIFFIKGKPVSIFVQGKYDIGTDSIIEATRKIIKFQRDWFQDYSQPYYTVTICNRSNNVAGTSFPNLFVCFVMPEANKLQLFKLLSHEMFHRWLPNRLVIKTEENESSLKYAWFYEGFTDYFSRKILLEAGIINKKEFINSLNTDLYLIANNKSANETYSQMLERREQHKFSGEQNKLYYYKGCLMALKWDAQIQQKNPQKSLKQLLLELMEQAKKGKNEEIDFQYLVDKGNEYGINVKEDFNHYIIQGKDVVLNSKSFNSDYILKITKLPLFQKGFEVDYGEVSTIKEVVKYSNAYKAGLRKGMVYLGAKNSYIFGNAWMPDKPILVQVQIGGKEKTVTYKPEGKLIKIQQFVKN